MTGYSVPLVVSALSIPELEGIVPALRSARMCIYGTNVYLHVGLCLKVGSP